MNKGESVSFSYNSGVQSFTAPNAGWYKLEAWGSSGDRGNAHGGTPPGGAGGYAMGFVKLKKNETIYIVCGGKTYNGGGSASSGGSNGAYWSAGCGGGATHMARVTGTLASIGKTTFDQKGLIVAGGGGGGVVWTNNAGDVVTVGTQNGRSGGTGGGNGFANGGSGSGGTPQYLGDASVYGAGGGGYSGGSRSSNHTGGIGGTSWVGGVVAYKGTEPVMTAGQNAYSATGKAKITLMSKSSVYLGNKECEVHLGNKEIDSIHLGEQDVG